jgi:hypothetical protein
MHSIALAANPALLPPGKCESISPFGLAGIAENLLDEHIQ